jgi:hypothetical protein
MNTHINKYTYKQTHLYFMPLTNSKSNQEGGVSQCNIHSHPATLPASVTEAGKDKNFLFHEARCSHTPQFWPMRNKRKSSRVRRLYKRMFVKPKADEVGAMPSPFLEHRPKKELGWQMQN